MLEHKDTFEAIKDQIAAFDDEVVIEEGVHHTLTHKQKDLNSRIRLYDHSTFETGNTNFIEGQRIEKSFENISNHRRDVWVRSNDFDTKDVEFIPDEPEFATQSMIYSKETHNYMYDTGMGETFNRLGWQRATYGSGFLKRHRDNSLGVPSIHSLIMNQVDMDSAPVIEVHEITAEKAYRRKDSWDNYDKLMEMFKKPNGIIDTTKTVKIYEVHGMLPWQGDFEGKHLLLAGVDEEKEIVLFEENEKEIRYKKVDWEEVEGRTQGRGAFETGFQAQVVRNRVRLQQDAIMRIASKMGMATDDETFEQNVNELENGFIWNLQQGRKVMPVQFNTSVVPQLDQLADQWDKNFERLSTTYEAVTGETALSGTPFRSLALQNQEGTSMLAYRREQLGLFYEEVFDEWVMPDIAKKITKKHLLSGTYSTTQLKVIDQSFANYISRKRIIDDLKSGKGVATQEEYDALSAIARQTAQKGKTRRFLDVPKGYLTAAGRVKVVTTNEQRNKQETMDRLFNIFQQGAAMGNLLAIEPFKTIFAKIVDLSGAGISSSELDFSAMQSQGGQPQGSIPAPQKDKGVALQDTGLTA